ncbi:DUF4247 domain-containing protein [Saccharopolyspora erythraea]|uniref:DUF4247 domain-containing protein n=1 Tax=Saccharopolyspora erythraea TaxID=1836 RepID=UPI001BA43E7A|nr:DUF4247 domain-containing protein [Saccharopolyspora erythraea]QUG99829.1 DUF4247 domain-containing protein [Saccharopolyspora erythraea]
MKPRLWFLLGGICAVLALVIALVMIFSTGTGPRGYVSNHYQRAAHLDLRGDDDNRAYTSPLTPSVVSRDITSRWKPIAQAADTSGIYLRYKDDAVIVQPRDRGSVIHVMDVDHAYHRYHSHVGGTWGWIGTHGESFRGRGPGAGK